MERPYCSRTTIDVSDSSMDGHAGTHNGECFYGAVVSLARVDAGVDEEWLSTDGQNEQKRHKQEQEEQEQEQDAQKGLEGIATCEESSEQWPTTFIREDLTKGNPQGDDHTTRHVINTTPPM